MEKTFKKSLNIALVIIIIFTIAPLTNATENSENSSSIFNRWFVTSITGKPAGYAHEQVVKKKNHIITSATQRIQIDRGGFTITLEQKSKFIETKSGKPVKIIFYSKQSSQAQTKVIHFTKNGRTLTTKRGKFNKTITLPKIKKSWLTPVQEHKFLVKKIKNGAKHFSYRTLEPDMGNQLISKTFTRKATENIQVYGKTIKAVSWEVTSSKMPNMIIHLYTDLNGRDARATVEPIPGIKMTTLWADKQLAKAKKSAPKIVASLLIHPGKVINSPRTLTKAIFNIHITGKNGKDITLPQTGYQRVKRLDTNNLQVTVNLNSSVKDSYKPTKADKNASAMIDSEDPKIIALEKQILEKNKTSLNDLQKAQLLRKAVYNYITATNLSVGMASASEVCQTKEGDCTEHAVLLAALLRAADIPSRTATGLIYVHNFLGKQNVFGYHMWTQAWIKSKKYPQGRWLDLDATLPASGPAFDATHITLGTSNMSSKNKQNDLIKMIPLFGQLQIEVIDSH